MSLYAEIILPLAVPGTYTYSVPEKLRDRAKRGMRAEVQLGKRKIYSGVILELKDSYPGSHVIKPLLNIPDDEPVVYPEQLKLWQWMSEYYCCNLGEVMNASLPAGLKLESESSITLNPTFKGDYTQLSDREYLVAEALELQSELKFSEVAQLLQTRSVNNIINALVEKNVVIVKEDLVERYTPRTTIWIKLSDGYADESAFHELMDSLEKKQKQLDVLLGYVQLSEKHVSGGLVKKKELLTDKRLSPGSLQTLIKNGIFTTEEHPETDDIELHTPIAFDLSFAQLQAQAEIIKSFEDKNVTLLHGVTGSGKTNLYIRLIEQTLADGKQALYLLPEISLTTQITERLRRTFGNRIGIYHSKFNQRERVEIWNKVYNGEYDVVLGARSALLLPFNNIGLIIVDEEHDSSYKQHDPAPRYHARDTAVVYGQMLNAKVLLGTATPSMESWYNCKQGKYGYVELLERFGGSTLPEVMFVDMKSEQQLGLLQSRFSSVLMEHMQEALHLKQQIILFQNRRGFATYIECEACAYIPRCINCDVSLPYFRFSHQLKCNYCGYTQALMSKCPSCGDTRLKERGFGTERIEDDIKIYFPEARVARMDLDSVGTKEGHNKLIKAVEQRKIDILVGTQMVTKGLDFDNVTVAGIVNADQMVMYPDFRSQERAHQMIRQVSGRAGRREYQGYVIVQTRRIGHPVFQFLTKEAHEQYYEWELKQREELKFPPFTRLIRLTFSHKDLETCRVASAHFASQLFEHFPEYVNGPFQAIIRRKRNLYFYEVLLKLDKSSATLSKALQLVRENITALSTNPNWKQVRVVPDVDPY